MSSSLAVLSDQGRIWCVRLLWLEVLTASVLRHTPPAMPRAMDGAGLLGAQPQQMKGGALDASVPVASEMPADQRFDPESVQVNQAPCAAEMAEAVVWAESVRPAVIATPTSACSCWIVLAGLLQVALFVTFADSLTTTARGAWDVHEGCPPGMDPASCSKETRYRDEYGGTIALLCVMIVVEFCACPSARFLRNVLQDRSAYQHVESVRKAPPSVRWRIQCYHYETRHYTETRTDSEGKEHTEHKTEQVRVDTWRASFECACESRLVAPTTHGCLCNAACERMGVGERWCSDVPYYWEDISSPFPDIGTASLTRLTFDKDWTFADAASAEHFSRSKRQFLRMNRRDIHYGTSSVAAPLCVALGLGTLPLHNIKSSMAKNVRVVFCAVQTSARICTCLGSDPTCWHAKTLAQSRHGSISGVFTLHHCAA